VDAVAPVDEFGLEYADGDQAEPNPDNTPRGAEIAAAAKRANSVLTGICIGAAIALPAAVWATLMPGREKATAAAILAGLFVLIFISRARTFADRRQAVALVCGAAVAVTLGVAKYVLDVPAESGAAVLWGALALAAFGFAGLLAALLVPVTRFTPLVRMLAEWLELVAIVAALPLAAWIGGLFEWVRMR
jgi:type VII secretion integral membrane protein EccD